MTRPRKKSWRKRDSNPESSALEADALTTRPTRWCLWEPKHGKRSVGGQAGTVVDLLEADTGVPRDCLPAVMDDRVGWRKRAVRGTRGGWVGGGGGGGGRLRST